MSRETYNLILAAAIVSIALNPLLMRAVPDAPPVKAPKAGGGGQDGVVWTAGAPPAAIVECKLAVKIETTNAGEGAGGPDSRLA